MSYRLLESSGDVALEAQGADLGHVLVEFGRGLSDILTSGSAIRPATAREVHIAARSPDLAGLAVAWINELLFLFDSEGLLVAGGRVVVDGQAEPPSARGRLEVDVFDPARHQRGTEVKAATYHGARLETHGRSSHGYLLLDL